MNIACVACFDYLFVLSMTSHGNECKSFSECKGKIFLTFLVHEVNNI